ncbi:MULTISPECIES: universal stress protein [unclassified Hoeflea]|uniref:universal stress protein n=1 Tax=unclassified Hoeflea TaxID=2614931 RepID=UPI002AFE54F6|nr:universal stress protein [Hoeflea sp.]
MYSKIMVPVDLTHAVQLEKALTTAADLAKLYNSSVTIVGVAGAEPGPVSHNPKEFAAKLDAFASDQSVRHGVTFAAMAKTSHDPAVDLDFRLKEAAEELGADLVVMASHVPGFLDHFFSSKAGYLASHVGISVFIIR